VNLLLAQRVERLKTILRQSESTQPAFADLWETAYDTDVEEGVGGTY
jgi:hypothetical protein